jgi:hypothetical protein
MNNYAKAFELAFAAIIRAYGDLVPGVTLRCWQTLSQEQAAAQNEKSFPLVDIRAAPPATDENQVTLFADVALTCATYAEDDLSHSVIAQLYGGVQAVCDQLYAEFRDGSGAALSAFTAAVASETGETFGFGGLSFQGGTPPDEDGSVNAIGTTMRVHYSRNW